MTPQETPELARDAMARLVLRWRESTHDIYKTQSFVCHQSWIEHSVGSAGYEVFSDSFGWTATWWHGNRGHHLGRAADAESMKEQCHIHLETMLNMSAKWKHIGMCAMDTAGLLIADPCYVIPDKADREIDDYGAWVACKDEVLTIPFKKGHEGAGIIIHSPNGDGTVDVYGKIDAQGMVRAVFFSFDGGKPT